MLWGYTHRMIKVFCLLCFIFKHTYQADLVAQSYNFNRFSLPEGLSQSQVLDIAQDTLGRIWLATERGGITIFSGEYPSYIDRNQGLPGTKTISLFYDNKHRMWIGTDKGVRYHNGVKLIKPVNSAIFDTVAVFDIAQRSDGVIVLATSNGVYQYFENKGFTNLVLSLANTPVQQIVARSNNLLYLVSQNNPLMIFDGDTLENVILPLTDSVNIKRCCFDSQDRLLVATNKGLIIRSNYKYQTYTHSNGLLDDNVLSVSEDRFGNIWIGTHDGGISIISDEQIINITSRQGIGSNRVNALFCDKYKNMWIGTADAGAYVFKGLRFTRIDTPEFIETTSVTALHISPSSETIIGTSSCGLLIIGNKNRKLFTAKNGLRSNTINTITTDSKRIIYVGTPKGVDVIYQGRVSKSKTKRIGITKPVNKLFTDKRGDIWIGTLGYGLCYYGRNSQRLFTKECGLAGNTVYDINQNLLNEIYIATDKGLSVITEKAIRNYSRSEGLPSDTITSMIFDKNNNLWAVTDKGLSLFDGQQFCNYSIDSLTEANVIYSIVNDMFGNLILGTELGIDILEIDVDSKILSKRSQRREDGFFGIECNSNSVVKGEQGEVLFGTKQGVTIFNSLADSVTNPIPTAYIRNIELFYRDIDWTIYDDTINHSMFLPDNIIFPHNKNNLTFHFAANDFQTSQKLMFQFYLEGFDQTWSVPINRRFINYTNLPPGKYTMMVRSWYSDNDYSKEPTAYNFEILKPLYRQLWFIALMTISVTMMFVVLWKWRLKAVRRNERRLEGIILERTNDLQKQKEQLQAANVQIMSNSHMKEQLLANTSHEIRTPLNVISGYTNLLLNTKVDNRQGKYLNYIKESSENLKVIINDILDFSKIEADKLELEYIPFDYIKSINATVNHLEIEAAKKGLELQQNNEATANTVVMGDPVRLNQIVSNLLRNAIKFTHKGSIKINVRDLCTNNEKVLLEIEVIDTGIGIPANKIDKVFESFSQASSLSTRKYGGTGLGLSIVKRLVEKQKGTIEVESRENIGSKFKVVLPFNISDINPEEDNKLDYIIKPHLLTRDLWILIVDDNQVNLALAENTITSYSPQISIRTATNGAEAVEKASQVAFDLIIMDVQMPKMDGYTATQTIRETLPHPLCATPILGMTAHAMKYERVKCLQYGMNECLTKPFMPRQLFETILQLTNTQAQPVNSNQNIALSEQPAFDTIKPTLLWKNSAGKTERFVKYMQMYLITTDKHLIDLENSCSNNNKSEIKLLAHTLKTSFRYLGMQKAQEMAYRIEKMSSVAIPTNNDIILECIKKEWSIATQEINRYIDSFIEQTNNK